MASFKAGDRVSIVAREATAEDDRTGLYRSYFGGLRGKIDRIYDDGSVCVEVDIESLPEEVRERHLAMQEAERKRWLDGLSNEVRNRLTPEQRQLNMSYRILVSQKDVIPAEKKAAAGAGSAARQTSDGTAGTGEQRQTPETRPPRRRGAGDAPQAADASGMVRRITEAELAAAEEEHLKQLRGET